MISLAEAVKLKSILNRKIQDLSMEIHRFSHTVVEKGEQPKIQERTLAQVEQELSKVRKDSRTLDRLIYRANIDHSVLFNGEQLPIVEAIELATQLRAEASTAKDLGMSEKETFEHTYGETLLYRIALYDPAEYRQRANELEKQAHRLSNAINAKNYEVQIDFDDRDYF